MKITNKTQISTKLVKRIMALAKVQADGSHLVISHDNSEASKHGHYSSFLVDGVIEHRVNVATEGDIITLGHELRHLAQAQRLGVNKFNLIATEILEDDAQAFESYLLNKGY